MPEPARRTFPTSLRDTVRGWLEPAGWTFEEQEHPAVGIGLADGEFLWVDAVVRDERRPARRRAGRRPRAAVRLLPLLARPRRARPPRRASAARSARSSPGTC